MMRFASGLLLALALGPVCAQAQDDDEWPPLRYLRNDYNDVVAVAHVKVSKAEIIGRIGGYENWKVVCKVIEPLKGRLRKGAELEYYHGAEAGFSSQLFLGQKIVFLLFGYDRTKGARVYSAMENSTLEYTADRVRKLRLIARSAQRKQPRQRRRIPQSETSRHGIVSSSVLIQTSPGSNWVSTPAL